MIGFIGWLIATAAFASFCYMVGDEFTVKGFAKAFGYVVAIQAAVACILFGIWLMMGAPIS